MKGFGFGNGTGSGTKTPGTVIRSGWSAYSSADCGGGGTGGITYCGAGVLTTTVSLAICALAARNVTNASQQRDPRPMDVPKFHGASQCPVSPAGKGGGIVSELGGWTRSGVPPKWG
jgi:hypothetical protein